VTTCAVRQGRPGVTTGGSSQEGEANGFLGEAATEIGATGTWRDPSGTADDLAAANTLLQLEYGETATESAGILRSSLGAPLLTSLRARS
jgi:hypothetical protein